MLDLTAIGIRVKELRGGLSQGEFADKLGYGQPFVSEIERGKKAPSIEFLLALRFEYSVSIDFMVIGQKSAPFLGHDPLQVAIRDFAGRIKEIQKENNIPKAITVVCEGAHNQNVIGNEFCASI